MVSSPASLNGSTSRLIPFSSLLLLSWPPSPQQMHPKRLFPPPRAEPHAEAGPGASPGLPVQRVGPNCAAAPGLCIQHHLFPSLLPHALKGSPPIPALWDFPQGCRTCARALVPGSLSTCWTCAGTDSVIRRGKEIGRCPQEGQHSRAQGAAPQSLPRAPTPTP